MLIERVFGVLCLISLVFGSDVEMSEMQGLLKRPESQLSMQVISCIRDPICKTSFNLELEGMRPEWLGIALRAISITQISTYVLAVVSTLGSISSNNYVKHVFEAIYAGLFLSGFLGGTLATVLALYALLPGLCQVESKFWSVTNLLTMVLFLFGAPLLYELAPHLRDRPDIVPWWSTFLYALGGILCAHNGYYYLHNAHMHDYKRRVKDVIAAVEDDDKDRVLLESEGVALPERLYTEILGRIIQNGISSRQLDLLLNTSLSSKTPPRAVVGQFNPPLPAPYVGAVMRYIIRNVNESNLHTFRMSIHYDAVKDMVKAKKDFCLMKQFTTKYLLSELIPLIAAFYFGGMFPVLINNSEDDDDYTAIDMN